MVVNPFMLTVPTFAVRETDVSRHNGGTSDAPLKPLRDDSTLRALSSLESLREDSKCWNGGHEWVNSTLAYRAFRLVARSSFVFVSSNCDWLEQIT